MNDLTTWPGSLELADLAPSKRLEIEGIQRAEDDIAGGFIKLGGHLCALKNLCMHGEFEALAAKYCRLGEAQRQNAMRVYREYGQKPTQLGFSATALVALTRAPDPQAALEEATARKESGEDVTARVAREIAAAQKAQREAESERDAMKADRDAVQLRLVEATTPNQENLIPELRRKRKAGGITEAEANALSLLPPDLQRVQYERIRRGEAIVQEREAAERTAAQAVQQQQQSMAEAQQARAEADEAKRRADELAREGAQSLIDDLNAQIETLNKQIARERETAWEEGKKAGARETEEVARKDVETLKQKLDESEKKNAAVQRKLNTANEQLESSAQSRRMAEARAMSAEEQLKSAHPLAKDNIHAGVIAHMTEDLRATLNKLEADCEPHQRKLSEEALQNLFDLVDGYLEKIHVTFIEGETL